MKITCPECGFSRDVNKDRIPNGGAVATCPKCSCRFRISPDQKPEDVRKTNPGVKAASQEPEEDIRQIAARAYQQESDRFREPEAYLKLNPWDEAPGENGWLSAFYQTVVQVMFQAQTFFRQILPDAKLNRALLFYLIICVVQTLAERAWGAFFLSMLTSDAVNDPQLEKVLSMLAPDENIALALILRTGLLILQLYFFSFLMFLVYRFFAPARATFSLVFQVIAYSSAPALLCVIPAVGSLAGTIWGIGCMLAGCKSALNLDWPKTLLGFVPLVVIYIPVVAHIMQMASQ